MTDITVLVRNVQQLSVALTQTEQELRRSGVRPSVETMPTVSAVAANLKSAQAQLQTVNRQYELLRKLVDTSALITSSLDLDQVLEEMMDIVVSLTKAERAYVMIKDKATDELKIMAARNWDKQTLEEGDVIFSRGVVGHVITHNEAVLTTNAQGDERFKELASVAANDLRSIVCVPVALRSEVIGALYADNHAVNGLFKPEMIPVLTAFASQSAVAIENARLYGQVRSDLNEAQAVVQRLQIQIDQGKTDNEIQEIENTDFFQKLRDSARMSRESLDLDLPADTSSENQDN
jgi:GAF domain-containing protein